MHTHPVVSGPVAHGGEVLGHVIDAELRRAELNHVDGAEPDIAGHRQDVIEHRHRRRRRRVEREPARDRVDHGERHAPICGPPCDVGRR